MRVSGAPSLRHLLNRSDFLRAARAKKAVTPGLMLQVRERTADESLAGTDPRVGYTASKKVGGAVTRNRARRRLRAAVNDVLAGVAKSGHDYVLVARLDTADRPYDALLNDLKSALERIEGGAPLRRARGGRRTKREPS